MLLFCFFSFLDSFVVVIVSVVVFFSWPADNIYFNIFCLFDVLSSFSFIRNEGKEMRNKKEILLVLSQSLLLQLEPLIYRHFRHSSLCDLFSSRQLGLHTASTVLAATYKSAYYLLRANRTLTATHNLMSVPVEHSLSSATAKFHRLSHLIAFFFYFVGSLFPFLRLIECDYIGSFSNAHSLKMNNKKKKEKVSFPPSPHPFPLISFSITAVFF